MACSHIFYYECTTCVIQPYMRNIVLFYCVQLPALPDSVSKRMDHSVSVFHLGAHCVWVLVFGGNSTDRYFKADTAIIELSEHSTVVCK